MGRTDAVRPSSIPRVTEPPIRPYADRRVLLGVAGGIASYKTAWLARLLSKAGAAVDVVMTRAATEFVGAVTFEALTGRAVHSGLFDPGRALDHIAGDAGLLRFFHGGKQPGVRVELRAAELRGDGDFFDEFADDLTLFQVNDRALCMEPLTSHKAPSLGAETASASRTC